MRTVLRLAAVFLALGTSVFWFFGGPDLGWTKDSIVHRYKDPVTELEVDIPEKRFIPGLDFLSPGLASATVLASISFFFADKPAISGNKSIRPSSDL